MSGRSSDPAGLERQTYCSALRIADREYRKQSARLGKGVASAFADDLVLRVLARYAAILKAQRDRARAQAHGLGADRKELLEALRWASDCLESVRAPEPWVGALRHRIADALVGYEEDLGG